MPTILLIRHGENSFVGKRLAGRLPGVHLNKNGQKQAQAVADLLNKAPLKAIYSSPLERAVETAQPLADLLHLPITIQPALIEIDFGEWQGKTIKQLSRRKLWKVVQGKPSEMRFPGGESFQEAQQRIAAGLEEIQAAWEEKDLIACFSHSDSIKLAVAHYLDVPLDSFQRLSIDTTSITALYLGKGGPRLFTINYILGLNFEPPKEEKHDQKKAKAAPNGNEALEPVQDTAEVMEQGHA
jgi:probable phosphomutase (TIGR03848 family)